MRIRRPFGIITNTESAFFPFIRKTAPRTGPVPPGISEKKRAEAQARAEISKRLGNEKRRLAKVEKDLETAQARYAELMDLMASEELYSDKEAFDKALAEYTALKPRIAQLEEQWLELSEALGSQVG